MKIESTDQTLLISFATACGLSGGFATEGSTTEARTAAAFGAALPLVVKLITYPCNKHIKGVYRLIPTFLLLLTGLTSIMLETSSEIHAGLTTTSATIAAASVFETCMQASYYNDDHPWPGNIISSFAAAAGAYFATLGLSDKSNPYHPTGAFLGGLVMTGLTYSFLDNENNLVHPSKRFSCSCLPSAAAQNYRRVEGEGR